MNAIQMSNKQALVVAPFGHHHIGSHHQNHHHDHLPLPSIYSYIYIYRVHRIGYVMSVVEMTYTTKTRFVTLIYAIQRVGYAHPNKQG